MSLAKRIFDIISTALITTQPSEFIIPEAKTGSPNHHIIPEEAGQSTSIIPEEEQG